MVIDKVTLADLEVFESRGGGRGVIDLLDNTRTSVGRKKLRERFATPLTDPDRIRDIQRAVRVLGEQPSAVRLEELQVRAVINYARSNLQVSRGSNPRLRIIEAWLGVRYRDHLEEIRNGQLAVGALFDRTARICRVLSNPESDQLKVLVTRLGEITDQVRSVICTGPVLSVDRVIRLDLREEILEAIELVGELDALNSMAMAGAQAGWTTPDIVDSDSFFLEAEDAVHPFVEGAVPNPIRLNGGEPLVFLTGPNMAGKTTYLRTTALVVLLAQIGMNVPARRMRLAPVDTILTSLNPVDNLKAGVSYFFAEVMRVRDAATALAEGRRALILFDEVFKGTNVRDALEASSRVILGFAKSKRSGSIFSSHLAELEDTLRDDSSIRFCRFEGEVRGGVPTFKYRLQAGVSDQRLGLLLLEQANVPQLLERISA